MGEATELVCVLVRKDAARNGSVATREHVVSRSKAVLTAHGAKWEFQAGNLFLHEDGTDPELDPLEYYLDAPLTVRDEREGLARILEWPTMGCLDGYTAAGFGFSVGFSAHPGNPVRNVTLKVLASNALRENEDALAWFVSVGHALHRELRGGRTFMTQGLGLRQDFRMDEEHARLCNGRMAPFGFEFLDIGFDE